MIISNLQFLVVPFLTCLLLLLITSYFGIHVLKREIIFIDIALAQVAALGGVAVSLLEHKMNGAGASQYLQNHELFTFGFSLLFCLLAAFLFTLLKNPKIRVPVEAFIGITYAFATTAAVIILDKGAGGDIHIHDMLTGSLLWTTWDSLLSLFIVVVIIGTVHIIFKKQFVGLTETYNSTSGTIRNRKFWDFLFYFTFGIVIIEAIKTGGILTVFAFLILPASFSAFFSNSWRIRIILGLAAGLFSVLAGLILAMQMDASSSPYIILIMAVILAGGWAARSPLFWGKDKKLQS